MLFKNYFCGNKISEYGRRNGYVDFACFAKAFDAVLNNSIMGELENKGYYFEPVQGFEPQYENDETGEIITEEEYDDLELDEQYNYSECENYCEIYQYFIVSEPGAKLIQDYNIGYLFYNSDLDIYIWGITHWGTSWDYVLTDIECEKMEG